MNISRRNEQTTRIMTGGLGVNLTTLYLGMFDYIPVNNFSSMSGRSSWVEPVLAVDKVS